MKASVVDPIILCLLVTSLLFSGCDIVQKEEISRIKSPDAVVDAVLLRTNAGATTSFGYFLYIVPSGGKPMKDKEVLRADHVKNLKLYWKHPKFLEIHYDKGRICNFKNFWHAKNVQNYKYIVELRLMPQSQFSLK